LAVRGRQRVSHSESTAWSALGGDNVLQLDETHSAPPNEHEQSYCVPTHRPSVSAFTQRE
jgi:hypothetical protein